MTTLQKTIITLAITGTIAAGVYQTRQASHLRSEVKTLQQQQAQQVALSNQVQELTRERDRATNLLASLPSDNGPMKKNPPEVLKLRGEVGRLRLENAAISSTNAVSKITADPEARKMLRDQQKMGMTAIYKGFAQRANIGSEQMDKLNDLLADHIMDNVDHVTTVLRDKPGAEQMNEIFAAQDALLREQVQGLLGQDGLSQFQDYSRNLLGTISAEQFKSMLSGDDAARQEKSKQFAQAMQEEVPAALSAAGLPADYQTIPMLNFRNIASEQEAEKSLKLLDDIYARVAARSGSFLSADDLKKLEEFRTAAANNNRSILRINRTMMAPISQ